LKKNNTLIQINPSKLDTHDKKSASINRSGSQLFEKITLVNKISLFFVPRGKISNPDSTFNAEFKYVSSFSPSPTGFFVTAKLNVKEE
jgi:hypothetical protein